MKHLSFCYPMLKTMLILLSGMIFFGCTLADPPPPASAQHSEAYKKGVPGGIFTNTVEFNARVVSKQTKLRTLTLLKEDGNVENHQGRGRNSQL